MTDLVQVCIVSVDVSARDAAGCWDVLDAGERARADQFRDLRDRQRFTLAHGTLRILAGRALTVAPADLAWIPGRHGKPALAPPWSALDTSLSHSGELIATAISTGGPVGVDIQHWLPSAAAVRLAARFYPATEATFVAAGRDEDERADRFTQLWARKEAVVKAAGGRLWANLRIPVRDRDVVRCGEPPVAHRVMDVPAPPNYRAAVAVAGAGPIVLRLVDWPSEESAPALAG